MDDRTDRALKYYAKNPIDVFSQIKRHLSSRTQNARFVFVMGPPRSGTTLLHRILLNHSSIEGFSYETSIISPKPIFDFTRFEHYVDNESYKTAIRETRDLTSFFTKIHELGLPQPPAEGWFVEKTPQHAKRLKFILEKFPNSKVIFCVRDARDTFCSGRAAGNIPQSQSVVRHAKYFNACMAPYFENMSSNRVKLLRYEDFVTSPEEKLGELMQFLNLTLEPPQLDMNKASSDARSSQKAFDRLNKPINDSTVQRWRTEMTQSEISEYNQISGLSLERLNYTVSA